MAVVLRFGGQLVSFALHLCDLAVVRKRASQIKLRSLDACFVDDRHAVRHARCQALILPISAALAVC